MTDYFVRCDLRGGSGYEKLALELESLNAQHVISSTWHVKAKSASASQLRNHLKQFLGSDDGILVIKASDWAVSVPATEFKQGI